MYQPVKSHFIWSILLHSLLGFLVYLAILTPRRPINFLGIPVGIRASVPATIKVEFISKSAIASKLPQKFVSKSTTHQSLKNQSGSNQLPAKLEDEGKSNQTFSSETIDSASKDTPLNSKIGNLEQPNKTANESEIPSNYLSELTAAIKSQVNYPPIAKARRQSGRVLVGFTLQKSGLIENIHLVQSSFNERLDLAALDSVRNLGRFNSPSGDVGSLGGISENRLRRDWNIVVPIDFKIE